jgi:hypothetical protein
VTVEQGVKVLIGKAEIDSMNLPFICCCTNEEIFGLEVAVDIVAIVDVFKMRYQQSRQ